MARRMNSNNSSGVIAKYYLDALANLGVCPRLLRCDSGTENAKLSVLQPFFRYNDMNLVLKEIGLQRLSFNSEERG